MKNRIFASACILVMLVLCVQLARPLWGVATILLNPVTVSAEAKEVSTKTPTVQKTYKASLRVEPTIRQ